MKLSENINKLDYQKRKLSFVFALIVFCIVMFFELVFLSFKYYNYQRVVKAQLQTQIAKFIDSSYSDGIGYMSIPHNLDVKNIFSKSNVIVVDNKRKSIIHTSLSRSLADDILYLNLEKLSGINGFYETVINDDLYMILKEDLGVDGVSIYVFQRLSFTRVELVNELIWFSIIVGLFSLLLYYLGYRFTSYNLKPVEDNIKDMENFVHNAGHELKTPIAVISSSLQLARATKNYDQAIDESLIEIKNMNKLIEGLVNLADLSKNASQEKFLINDVAQEMVHSFKLKLQDKNIQLQFVENHQLRVKGNREYTYIMLSNIFSNAIKYTKAGGNIKIIIDKKDIMISDNGIGISKEGLEKVFERFFQDSDARSMADGHGIGMSLVKKIADFYGWKVVVFSEKGVGTSVKICF